MFAAAKELKAHDNATAGAAILDRAIEWQRDACCAERESFATHMTLARMLYDAERFSEASTTLAALRPMHANDIDATGLTGSIAAREGDVVGAESAMAALRAKTGRFHFGKHLLWCARIAAVRGDEMAASSFLRGAFARGYGYGIDLHTDVDLSLLSAHAWYKELLRPKG